MRASHDHQRTAGRRARVSPVLAAGSAPHSVVDHKSQMGRSTRPRNSSMRWHFHSTAPTCRGLHCATALSIRFAGATLRRQGGLTLPSLRRPASHSHAARGGLHRSRSFAASGFVPIRRCALARGPQFCLPEHSTRQCSDALEGHFVRPFLDSRSDDQNRDTGSDEACSRNPVMRFSQ
jgi:hypothetical protein